MQHVGPRLVALLVACAATAATDALTQEPPRITVELRVAAPADHPVPIQVVGVFSRPIGDTLGGAVLALDARLDGRLSAVRAALPDSFAVGHTLMLPLRDARVAPRRLLLMGLGDARQYAPERLRSAAESAMRVLLGMDVVEAGWANDILDGGVTGTDVAENTRAAIAGICAALAARQADVTAGRASPSALRRLILLAGSAFRTRAAIGLADGVRKCGPMLRLTTIASDDPPVLVLRHEEDWSAYAVRPVLQGWRRLKFLPLRSDRRAWLTLGGEWRPWWERFTHEEWAAETEDAGGYLQQRVMVHADLHLAGGWRTFLQLKHGSVSGRAGGATPVMRDDLDVNQAFVEWTSRAWRVRVGRQELRYGGGRMVDVREGANVRFGSDGLRVDATVAGVALSVFGVRPSATRAGVLDDGWVAGRGLWGTYAQVPLAPADGLRQELYYIGSRRRLATFAAGDGPETRHTIGTRTVIERGRLSGDLELAVQRGRFAAGALAAWTTAFRAQVRTSRLLRVGLFGGLASGDADLDDGRLETFQPPQPRGAYFGQINSVGPSNVMTLHPSVELQPSPSLVISTDLFFHWRHRAADAVYAVPGQRVRDPAPGRSRFLGWQPQLLLDWTFAPFTTLTLNPAVFVGGPSLDVPERAPTTTYLGGWVTVRF